MSIWFNKRERGGGMGRFSASFPFTLVYVLIVLLALSLLPVLVWLVRLFR